MLIGVITFDRSGKPNARSEFDVPQVPSVGELIEIDEDPYERPLYEVCQVAHLPWQKNGVVAEIWVQQVTGRADARGIAACAKLRQTNADG